MIKYCNGFCHTSVWISHRYTCVPSLLSTPPFSLPTPSLQVVWSIVALQCIFISAVQKSESVIHTYISPLFWISSPFMSPDRSVGKESACNAGDPSSIPGLGRSTGEGKGYPLQYFGLENSMYCIVHGVSKSQTWLSSFHWLHLGHHRVLSRVLCALQEALVSYFNYVSLHLLRRV